MGEIRKLLRKLPPPITVRKLPLKRHFNQRDLALYQQPTSKQWEWSNHSVHNCTTFQTGHTCYNHTNFMYICGTESNSHILLFKATQTLLLSEVTRANACNFKTNITYDYGPQFQRALTKRCSSAHYGKHSTYSTLLYFIWVLLHLSWYVRLVIHDINPPRTYNILPYF